MTPDEAVVVRQLLGLVVERAHGPGVDDIVKRAEAALLNEERGMEVDGDVLHSCIVDAVPGYLADWAARDIADDALDGAVRAGMAVLHGPGLTRRAHPDGRPAQAIEAGGSRG